MRPPIRLAALSGLQTIYVFTHDSIFVGEDGPTHEPVEHLARAAGDPARARHPPRRRQRDQLRLALRPAAQARDQPARALAPEPDRLRPHQDRAGRGPAQGRLHALGNRRRARTPDIHSHRQPAPSWRWPTRPERSWLRTASRCAWFHCLAGKFSTRSRRSIATACCLRRSSAASASRRAWSSAGKSTSAMRASLSA